MGATFFDAIRLASAWRDTYSDNRQALMARFNAIIKINF